ncbi:MAG: hypothetical protein ABSA05_11330 [Opitutaceae bacterium]|jgi:hypothetical protein
MNGLKLSCLTVSAALVIGGGAVAHAYNVENGYYYFEASAGQPTAVNGSWVEFSNDTIVNWDLLDTTSYSWETGPAYPSDFPPLTPGNSAIIEYSTYDYPATNGSLGTGPDSFYFEIGSPTTATTTGDSDFWFLGVNNNAYFAYNLLGDSVVSSYNTGGVDPDGTWNYSATQLPDAANTLGLLSMALVALGACAHRLRKSA